MVLPYRCRDLWEVSIERRLAVPGLEEYARASIHLAANICHKEGETGTGKQSQRHRGHQLSASRHRLYWLASFVPKHGP